MLSTVVEGDLKAPLSIATTLRYRRRLYFPWFVYFTLDSHIIMLSVKQEIIKYQFFESFVWLNLELNPHFPGHLRIIYPLVTVKQKINEAVE